MFRQSFSTLTRRSALNALRSSITTTTTTAAVPARSSFFYSQLRCASSITEDIKTTHDVLDKPKYTRLRKKLEADDRYRVTNEEYIEMARSEELTPEEATKFAKKLEDAMVIMKFQQAPKWVFLKPERLSKHMHDVLDPDATQSQQAIARKTAELEKLFSERDLLTQKKKDLDVKAHGKANRFMWLCAGLMTVQAAGVARLTWWELSWDIMEPITYLITYGTGIMALVYFGITRAEYTYESLHDRLAKRNQLKLYRKNNFDMNHYQRVQAKINLLQQDLKVLGAPWTSPPHLESDDLDARLHVCEENPSSSASSTL